MRHDVKYAALVLQFALILGLDVPAFAQENHHINVRTTVCEAGQACQQARLRVWDGDTFILEKAGSKPTKIRLGNIDTPEIAGRCHFETVLAQRAKSRLAALLAGGVVEINPDKLDRYGRQLAEVAIAAGDVGEILIAENLARPWDGARHPWC